ncbi:unnamed protein product [Brassica napus]|nr:unnamed protein product [Brassica napus]
MGVLLLLQGEMALRQMLGWSEGDLMRSDAKPCSRLMRQTAAIFTVGGALVSGFSADFTMVRGLQCQEVCDGLGVELCP